LRGLSKLFRAPIYWAHRAVVFAIARLSCICFYLPVSLVELVVYVLGVLLLVLCIWLAAAVNVVFQPTLSFDCDFPTAKTCLFDATKDRFVPSKNCFHRKCVALALPTR